MSDASPAEAPPAVPPTESRPVSVRIREMPLARRAVFAGFATLVALGAAFYVWWGMAFGVWIDNGVYAVFITLVLFGLAGMWLVFPEPPARSPESA